MEKNKPLKILTIVLAVIIVILIASFFLFENKEDGDTVIVIDETAIKIEIADTPAERAQGLSGRESLPEDSGLFFAFETPDFHNFWMKDMNFPIDIIWMDSNFIIVDITENMSPDTYPDKFTSKEKAQYVLEVNAGFVSRHDIRIGEGFNIF